MTILLTVLALGLDASSKDATYLFRHPGQLVRSILPMYLILLLVAGAIVSAFDIHPAVKIALVALSVSPIPLILPKKQLRQAQNINRYTSRLILRTLLHRARCSDSICP